MWEINISETGNIAGLKVNGASLRTRRPISIDELPRIFNQVNATMNLIILDSNQALQTNDNGLQPFTQEEVIRFLNRSTQGQYALLKMIALHGNIARDLVIERLSHAGIIPPDVQQKGKFIAGMRAGITRRLRGREPFFSTDSEGALFTINEHSRQLLARAFDHVEGLSRGI